MRMRVHLWHCSVGQRSHIVVSCGVGCRHGSDPLLLWLWHRLAAVVLIHPYATDATLKSKEKKDFFFKFRMSNYPENKRSLHLQIVIFFFFNETC